MKAQDSGDTFRVSRGGADLTRAQNERRCWTMARSPSPYATSLRGLGVSFQNATR